MDEKLIFLFELFPWADQGPLQSDRSSAWCARSMLPMRTEAPSASQVNKF